MYIGNIVLTAVFCNDCENCPGNISKKTENPLCAKLTRGDTVEYYQTFPNPCRFEQVLCLENDDEFKWVMVHGGKCPYNKDPFGGDEAIYGDAE